METVLTTTETNRLESLEAVIGSGMQTFAEVGNALLAIRDGRLYRASHGTFEAYCRDRWGMTNRHANRLIESAAVVANVGPIGPKPETESQARPLAKLEPNEQPVAWKEATYKAESEGRRVTARDVEKAVEERKESKARNTTPARSRGSFTDWQKLRELFEIIQDAVNQMGDLKVDAQHRIQARSMCEAMSGRFNKLAQKLVE
jgi:hypothetical protein